MMAAAGLLNRDPDREPLCKMGRIVTGQHPNSDGHPLPPDDVAWLTEQFMERRSQRWVWTKLVDAGFDVSDTTVDRHLRPNHCSCGPDVPLSGLADA